jgi:hypothetical protein
MRGWAHRPKLSRAFLATNVLRNCERSSKRVAASSQFTEPARSANLSNGDVSERPKVLVSKTSVRESAPRVQIPPSPRESKKEPGKQALFYFAVDVGVSGSRLVNPKHKFLAVSHRSGDNFAAKRGARVQIPPSPPGPSEATSYVDSVAAACANNCGGR